MIPVHVFFRSRLDDFTTLSERVGRCGRGMGSRADFGAGVTRFYLSLSNKSLIPKAGSAHFLSLAISRGSSGAIITLFLSS